MKNENVKYYIQELENGTYLSEFDFPDTTDTFWVENYKYAFPFETLLAAFAIKTYIKEVCLQDYKLVVVEKKGDE